MRGPINMTLFGPEEVFSDVADESDGSVEFEFQGAIDGRGWLWGQARAIFGRGLNADSADCVFEDFGSDDGKTIRASKFVYWRVSSSAKWTP